jgi:Tfp pilus assembly PilM family ATPase
LKASISFATQEYAQGRVDRIFVTGEGAALPGLVPRISAELGIEGRSVAPTDIADVAATISKHGASPLLTAAVGLASHPDG